MKKAVLLIAALFIVGSLAFAAPNVSIGFWGRTVLVLAASNSDLDDVYVGWGPNWGGKGPRMGITFGVTGEKLEFKFNARINGSGVGDGNFEFADCYGVLKFIPDLLTVNVGYMNNDGLDNFRKTSPNTIGDLHNQNIGRMDHWGLWVILAPKDSGFELAAQLKTPAPDATNLVEWAFLASEHYDLDWTLMDILLLSNIAASYKIPDVLKITAGFVTPPQDNGESFDFNNLQRNIFARVELLMVPGMTLWIDARFYGFEDELFNMKYNLGFGYKIGDLNLMLGAAVTVPDDGLDHIQLTINPNVEYDLGPVTAGVAASIGIDTLENSNMSIQAMPYVNLDDFSCLIGFDLHYNTENTPEMSWCVPILFTFSFW